MLVSEIPGRASSCAHGGLCPRVTACAARARAQDDPETLYRQREDLASAELAATILAASAASDYDAAWKLARVRWIGTHAPSDKQRAALERGIAVPRLFGGSRSKGQAYLTHVLDVFPNNVITVAFLAQLLQDEHRPDEARAMWERVLATPIDPDWAPEALDLHRKAAARLASLANAATSAR